MVLCATNITLPASIHRHVDQEIKLSNGSTLPKGSRMLVSADSFMDPEVYTEPDKFDLYRFHNLRSQTKDSNGHQYVTTSSQHLLFGHGTHACPGRFFASNEMKIALCHLLLKYDWKLCEGETERPANLQADAGFLTNPGAKVMCRRRKEEINIDAVVE